MQLSSFCCAGRLRKMHDARIAVWVRRARQREYQRIPSMREKWQRYIKGAVINHRLRIREPSMSSRRRGGLSSTAGRNPFQRARQGFRNLSFRNAWRNREREARLKRYFNLSRSADGERNREIAIQIDRDVYLKLRDLWWFYSVSDVINRWIMHFARAVSSNNPFGFSMQSGLTAIIL